MWTLIHQAPAGAVSREKSVVKKMPSRYGSSALAKGVNKKQVSEL